MELNVQVVYQDGCLTTTLVIEAGVNELYCKSFVDAVDLNLAVAEHFRVLSEELKATPRF